MKKGQELKYHHVQEAREVAKHFGWTIRETENQVRKYMDGANAREREALYKDAFAKKDK